MNQYDSDLPPALCWNAKAGRLTAMLSCILAWGSIALAWWALQQERETMEEAKKNKAEHDAYWIGKWDEGDEIDAQQAFQLSMIQK